jgi:phospholipid/cholesterol/gamma-HCH transport system substrate-binding protein
MAQSESRHTETAVGLFVILGLAVTSVLVFSIAGKQKLFEPRYNLIAVFTQVSGLKVGSPVRLAGLEVGSVESLNFTADGKVLAVLSIRSRYQNQIRSDSVATISSVGILGDKTIELTIGSNKVSSLSHGSPLQSKDPLDVSELIDKAGPMAAKVDEILTYLSKITGEFSMQNLNMADTFQHANNILKKIDDGSGSIGAAINDPLLYKKFVSLADAGQETTEILMTTLDRFDTATVELPALISATQDAMEDVSIISKSLRSSIEQLPTITQHVVETSGNVRTASEDLPAITNSFRNAATGAVDVVEAVKRSRLIRRNLPKTAVREERILLDEPLLINREAVQ